MPIMKTSLICLLLLLYMGVFYFSNRHLPIKSSRIFNGYYFVALTVIIFDFITLYTVNRPDIIPESLNLFVHTIYMLAINLMIYLNLQYEISLLAQQITISGRTHILQLLPLVITSVLILFLPLGYIEGKYTNYSMGPKVYALYASIIFYNLAMLYYGLRYNKILDREKRVALLASIPIFFILSIISIVMPESLFVIVYIILTAVGLLMSSENTEKYIDKQTGMFNQYGLGIVSTEYMRSHKNAVAAVISLGEAKNTNNSIDWRNYVTIMEQLQVYSKKEFNQQMYRVGDNGFVLLANSKDMAIYYAEKIITYASSLYENALSVEYETVALTDCASSDELMSRIVEICINAINKSANFDFLTGVRNRNAFEKYLTQMHKEKADAYYFMVDVNNLKETNDVLGHSAGDDLLQSVAHLLRDTVGENGFVFRQGGDEFSILWKHDNPALLLDLLEENRQKLNLTRIIPVSFAIGYGHILDENGMDKADNMMYENKRRMKANMQR